MTLIIWHCRIQKWFWHNAFLHSFKKGLLHFHRRFVAVGNEVCKSGNMTTESVFKNSIWIAKALIYREKVWGRRETSSYMKINVDKLYFSFTFFLITSRESDTRFSALSFFINQFTLDPWVSYWDHFEFFRKIRGDIREWMVFQSCQLQRLVFFLMLRCDLFEWALSIAH